MLSLRVTAIALLCGVAAGASAADRPVVVELFTSEGCSSCPPADAVLTAMAESRRDVLPLAFHVTYWDRLGWKDPFGLAAATARQKAYAARFGDGSYTPELVVAGRKGVVGSDRSAVEAAITDARQRPGPMADVALSRTGGMLSISVAKGGASGRVLLVGYDPRHETAIGRGENAGRLLTESNIVRSIRPIGEWTGLPLTLSSALPDGQAVAVLIEAPDGAVIGAARLEGSS